MTDARLTPLHDEHVALGATLVPFAGWSMPLRYSSDVAEHTAVRTAAGLFDLSHMGEIHVTGPQAAAALDYALVGQASAIGCSPEDPPQGRARYSLLCAPDGGVLDDLIVYRLSETSFMIVANAANTDLVVAELTARAAGFDATVTDATATTALIAVQGPRAEQIVTDVLATTDDKRAELVALRYYAWCTADIEPDPGSHPGASPDDQVPVLVGRTGYTGEDGFELFLPAADAAPLWRSLLAAGASHGLVPAGLAARDSLRLEAGMPLYGHELDRTTSPQDAGLGRVVRLDKTDAEGNPLPFVGRGPLESRAHAPGARCLVGLQGLGRRAARAGYPVLASADGPQIGTVTSGAPSPTLGYPIAMAYVTPERSAEGTELAVDVRGRPEPVRVVPLPFYRRPK